MPCKQKDFEDANDVTLLQYIKAALKEWEKRHGTWSAIKVALGVVLPDVVKDD